MLMAAPLNRPSRTEPLTVTTFNKAPPLALVRAETRVLLGGSGRRAAELQRPTLQTVAALFSAIVWSFWQLKHEEYVYVCVCIYTFTYIYIYIYYKNSLICPAKGPREHSHVPNAHTHIHTLAVDCNHICRLFSAVDAE